MEKSKKHLDDLNEIRNIMEKSTKFLSLSGWSGIVAGFFGLQGAIIAWLYLDGGAVMYDESFQILNGSSGISPRSFFLIDAGATLILALSSALFFSYIKAKKNGEKIWSPVVRRLLFHLAIPLLTGGLLALILIGQNQPGYVAAITLLFYGTALVNAGKYTNNEVIYLGLAEIALGLAAALWQGLGLYFWATGFGLFHILYGVVLYFRYDRNIAR